ncbi:glycosyltransferase [Paenibacillus illinoisensis]|uniref:glycosyltransferase n=1 Tax=Paenibacillus illinoisensis TaxID=59845 RepID=UPI003D2D6A96
MKACSVDIIIPVYNAPQELEECYKSLLKYTDLERNRIIIINDCSPDSGVNEFLDKISDERTLVLQNDVNLGFVGTVNRGMALSDSDVVLLNSDTIVTEKWLNKLVEVAYTEEDIATVTPLTNNGTICSVPNFLEDNNLPEGYTIDSFARLIERISYRDFPVIPTAVGFCMYIKRSVLNEVGLFDEENFGKGYGEENDFCCRVIEHGYKNVLDDHTFIYHKGSMSFQGEKLELSKRNLKVLNSLYPYYDKLIQDFIIKNPLKFIHENIKVNLPLYQSADDVYGNILYVIHNFFDEPYNQPIGGTEYHLKDLVTESNFINSFVLVASENELVLKQYNKGTFVGKYNFPLKTPLTSMYFHHREYSDIVEKILGTFEINLIHIQHLIKHTFDIPRIAKKKNIKVLYTLHDFYLFCPPQIVSIKSDYYEQDEQNRNTVNKEFHGSYELSEAYVKRRKEEVNRLISYIDVFITPSNFTKDFYIDEYPALEGKIKVVEHGYATKQNDNKLITKKKDRTWNIGFLGGISPVKGSELVYRLIKKYPTNNINWHIIGGLGDQRLNLLNQTNLFKHGEYKRDELEGILKGLDLDLICCLSVVPETFSYTLSESWLCGIPVIVTPVGALKERVLKLNGGWISKSTRFEDIVSKLDEIMSDPDEWLTVVNHLQSLQFKSIPMMVDEYKELYLSCLQENFKSVKVFDNRELMRSLKFYMPSGTNNSQEYYNQVHQLEEEIRAIRGTMGWKLLDKLRANDSLVLKIGKRTIYVVLKYFYKRIK